MSFFVVTAAFAQQYVVTTIAGSGTFGGDGGPATQALVDPAAVVVDGGGNIYVSDPENFRIRKIDAAGTITTLIGKGYSGFSGDGGSAAAATMSSSSALAVDSAANLYFTDDTNQRLREVTRTGIVKTVAGNGTCGTTKAGMAAAQAPLCDIESVAVDAHDRVFFGSNGQVWMIAADGTLVLIAGNGGTGNTGDGGQATSAQIGFPNSLAIDPSGNVYIADTFNFVIREVGANGQISTAATIADTSASNIELATDASGTLFYATGTAQVFKLVQGGPVAVATVNPPTAADYIAVDRTGALYVSSTGTERLLKISGGAPAEIAGAYPYGLDPLPQPAKNVRLHLDPTKGGLAVDANGNVYFPELGNDLVQRIDKVTPSGTMTALNTPSKLPNTNVNFTAGSLAIGPSGLIYFTTFTQVYRVEVNGSLTLIAGAPGFPSSLGDGGPATSAKLSNPSGLAFDQDGNLYIAEPFDSRVREVTPQNVITTFAGTGEAGYSGDGGQAASAKLAAPVDVKVAANGDVYIADVSAAVVRKVDRGGIITTVAGNGTHGFSGDGGLATKAELSGAAAIALDARGDLFIADRNQAAATFVPIPDNNRIRMVNPSGIISTITGDFAGYNGENVLSVLAASGGPEALATDAQGNLYVAEASTERVRKFTVTPSDASHPLKNVGSAADGFIATLAPDSIAAAYGDNLAPATENVTTLPLPIKVQGTTLQLVDSTGKQEMTQLFFVSGGPADQVNFLVPSDMAPGLATVIVTAQDGTVSKGTTNIAPVAPGIFQLNASGLAAAFAFDANTSTLNQVYQVSGGQVVAKPISLPASHTVVLELFGTGLRAAGTANVSVTVGTTPLVVQYAGKQGSYLGLDQINAVLPASLAGSGDVIVQVTANNVPANPVHITIQ